MYAKLIAANFNKKARPPGIPVLKVENSPALSAKIPENSRYENTAYIHPLCKPKFITIVIYLPISN